MIKCLNSNQANSNYFALFIPDHCTTLSHSAVTAFKKLCAAGATAKYFS